MRAYIYIINNKGNNKKYIGQTTNYSRRKTEHFTKLRENRHPNIKLQNAWNKYGEENFEIKKIVYEDITKEELDKEEIRYIAQYNSYEDGYNMTIGGTGGDCRSKLSFDEFCIAYFGNLKYDGMTNRTSKILKVDSSCIASIKRKESYDFFRERAEKLSKEEKKKYIEEFEKITNVKIEKPWVKQTTPSKERTLEILCVCSTYGRGTEGAILRKFGMNKGFLFHFFKGNGRQEIKEKYKKMSKEERQKLGRQKFEEWELYKYSTSKLTESYKDLFHHYGFAD